jgi:hypothetical protein
MIRISLGQMVEGAERLRITSDVYELCLNPKGGNVGIGSNSPNYKLDVADTIYSAKTLAPGTISTSVTRNDAKFLMYDIASTNWSGMGTDSGGRFWLTTGTAGTRELFVMDSSGRVGIGTALPGVQLHIKGRSPIRLTTTNGPSYSDYGQLVITDSTAPSATSVLGNLKIGYDASTGSFGTGFLQTVNPNVYTGPLVLQPYGGECGIGTTTPYAKLHINGAAGVLSSSSRAYYRWNDYNSTYNSLIIGTGNWSGMSIYATDSIVTKQYLTSHAGTISASDTRIKKNIVDADDAECLEVLRLLKPKKYQYKDEIERGQEPVWGFIAQEVRETLPHATQLRQDVLPNIYELANVSQSNVITFVNFNTSNLESNATTLIRTKGIDGEDHDVHLVEVIDEHTIRVEEDLTEWIGSVDETGNVITEITTTTITPEEYEGVEDTSGYVANISGYQNANVVISVEEYNALEDTAGYEEIIDNYTKTVTTYPGTQLFVYGQEVDDFVFIKKEAIWTVATAALQEVDRQLQAEKAKVATLESQLTSVLARLDALENA